MTYSFLPNMKIKKFIFNQCLQNNCKHAVISESYEYYCLSTNRSWVVFTKRELCALMTVKTHLQKNYFRFSKILPIQKYLVKDTNVLNKYVPKMMIFILLYILCTRIFLTHLLLKFDFSFSFFVQIKQRVTIKNVLNNVSGKFGVNIFIGKSQKIFSDNYGLQQSLDTYSHRTIDS